MFEYQIKPQIANVLSNRARIPYFSYGQYLNSFEEKSPSKINISFHVDQEIPKPNYPDQTFHFCYGRENVEELYFERRLAPGLKAQLHCKNLMGDPQIRVNKTYIKYIRSKIDNVFPPGVHLADTLSLHLLEKHYTPLHCAAVSLNNKGIILAAPPDTGKTVTTMLAVKRGFSFLSEDIAIADENYIYSNPQTATIYHVPGFIEKKSLRHRLSYFVETKIPGLGVIAVTIPGISYFLRPPISRIYELMKDIKIEERVPAEFIFILDRGQETLQEIDPSEAYRRMLIINRNEFSYHKNTLLFAYSYFNRSLDINAMLQKEERLIETLTRKARCYLVRSPNAANFINLINRAIL
jgi:hypothetical protein